MWCEMAKQKVIPAWMATCSSRKKDFLPGWTGRRRRSVDKPAYLKQGWRDVALCVLSLCFSDRGFFFFLLLFIWKEIDFGWCRTFHLHFLPVNCKRIRPDKIEWLKCVVGGVHSLCQSETGVPTGWWNGELGQNCDACDSGAKRFSQKSPPKC